jgi:hypothetical protein
MSTKKGKQPVIKQKEIPIKQQVKLPSYANDLIVIAIFIVLLLVMFGPMVFKGNIYPAGDVLETMSKSHMVNEYYKNTGHVALWNPYPLAGIPNVFYLPKSLFSLDFYIEKISDILSIPFVFFLIGAAGMYFLLRYLKFCVLISFAASLVFILVPYFSTLVFVGHSTKLQAIMYVPWIVMTFLVFLDRLKLLPLALFALSFSLQFQTMHFQVAFYTGLLLLFSGLSYLWNDIRQKSYLIFIKKAGLLISALIFVVLIASYPLFLAKKLSEHSLRANPGIDLLQNKTGTNANGVDPEEIRKWSPGPKEELAFLIPAGAGGTSNEKYTGKSFPSLKDQNLPLYWGNMDFSQGYDMYMGVIILFMVLFALLNYKNKLVLSMALSGLLLIIWSFGLSFKPFYMICYDFIPFFKNFRSPTTGLALVFFILPVLSAFGMQTIRNLENDDEKKLRKYFFIFLGVFFVVGVMIYFAGKAFSFMKPGQQLDPDSLSQIVSIRKEMFFSDLGRYFILLLVFSGLTVCYFYKIIRFNIWIAGVILLIFIDQGSIHFRYDAKSVSKNDIRQTYFAHTSMIDFFTNDAGNYRVYPLIQDRELLTYYMRTVGDYDLQMNPAVSDLYFNCLFPDSARKNDINWNVIRMLNVKYVVLPKGINDPKFELKHVDKERNNFVYLYKDHLSSGYFVNDYKVIPGDVERLKTINQASFDPAKTALLETIPTEKTEKPDSCSSNQTLVQPDRLSFDVYTNKQALYVISEVYFPEGWKIYLDDRQVMNIYKTDHAFQSLVVPAGNHKIRMEFIPAVYKTSRILSSIFSVILYVVILVFTFRKKR